MGPEFFQTPIGQKFYQKTMPDIEHWIWMGVNTVVAVIYVATLTVTFRR